MNFIQKTWSDFFRDQNYRYFSGLVGRMRQIGTIETIGELHQYNKKFVFLPRKIGKRGNLKYTLFVLYNYFKIIHIFPQIKKDTLLDYFPTRFQKFFLYDLDPKEEKIVTFNKLLFYRKLDSENIAYPKTFGYFKDGQLFNMNDLPLAQEDLMSLPDKLFVKPYEDNGGKNATVIKKNELEKMTDNLLFQEQQFNHHDIARLTGNFAFNTIRLITYIDNEENLKILSGIFRISTGKIVDNWGKGSINVKIDVEHGKLVGEGITKYKETFTHFPATGIAFDGFKFPMWDEFINLVNKAAFTFQNLRLIAWDIGFNEKGPVIIEANSGCDFFHAQLFNPYYQTPLIQDLIKNCKKN